MRKHGLRWNLGCLNTVPGSSENQTHKSQSADWDADLSADWKWERGGYALSLILFRNSSRTGLCSVGRPSLGILVQN